MKPMLAKDADPSKLKFPLYAQAKLDGIRCVIVDGKPLSRTLKEIPNREIFNALSDPNLEGLDGELVVGHPASDDAYRRTSSFVMAKDKTGEDWKFYVFDKHDLSLPYDQRKNYVDTNIPLDGRTTGLRSIVVNDQDELDWYEQEIIGLGYEGLILRSPNALYKYGRGSVTKGDLLKLKRYIDFEAEIVGYYEELHNANEATTNALGRTERSSVKANKHGKNRLGGFVLVAINGPSEGVEFRCGTGFNASERAEFWQQRSELVGQVVKVKSFPIGVKERPRHPVWLGMRDLSLDG
jgi:DNA ligase-1